MRPRLKPALRWLWRDQQTLQLGVDPDRALVVTGVDHGLADLLKSLTGLRTEEAIVTRALTRGVSGSSVQHLLRLLAEGGALDDADTTTGALRELGPAERERLQPDLAARSISTGSLDGGAESLLRRRRTRVAVYGAGRVGGSVATLLAAAGVGRVSIIDSSTAGPGDLSPAGLASGDVGGPRAEGIGRAIMSVAPSTEAEPVVEGHQQAERPHFAVIAPDDEPDRGLADALVRAGLPHLLVRMREARAILGPFVLPGASSCLRCHDLHRTARDPSWPQVLSQVLAEPTPTAACDVVLATGLAAFATLHLLAYADGVFPPSVDATLEMDLPWGAVRRRSWSSHPSCGCHWDPDPERPAVAA